jgi:methionyl-tRNA formyltransferase
VKIVFFGTPEFAVPALDALVEAGHDVALVVAQPDRPAGRGMKMQSTAVAMRAKQLGLDLMQPQRIRAVDFLERIRAISPAAGVVVAYGKILPQALLEIPSHGFINVHGSVLPKYRGAAPIQRAIAAGESESGVSIMQLDAEMDHGPVLAVAKTAIEPDERTPELAARLSAIGAIALIDVLARLENETAEAREQDHALATHAPKIEKEEARIDWSLPARTIYNRFRAFEPWPGIFAVVRDEPLKLTKIATVDRSGEPGTVLELPDLTIAAGDGAIRVIEVQRPGRRPVAAAEFARGVGLRSGERFE